MRIPSEPGRPRGCHHLTCWRAVLRPQGTGRVGLPLAGVAVVPDLRLDKHHAEGMWPALALAVAVLPGGAWPVDPPAITRPYRPPGVDWHAGHRGIDLAAITGQTVRAMADGVVGFVGVIGGIPIVTVRYPGDGHRRSTYEPVWAVVRPGQIVRQGDPLGSVAVAGGHCGGLTGCLHVGLRGDAGYLDPASLIGPVTIVLKPP
jgi:murein DD-endopeptidase MepM/ murein hydrolase activator NlpD